MPSFKLFSSGGGVTSVGLTAPSIFSVAGSPITTAGTLALTLATQTANLVWAGPTMGAAATPTFRALVAADIPDVSALYLTRANNLSDVASASTSRTNLGLGSLAVLSSVNNSNWSGTVLAVANGGSGTASPALVAGTNVTITGTWPNQTINSSGGGGGGGTVTSVDATVPSFLTVSGGPVTTSGTLAFGLSGTALPVVNGGTGTTTPGIVAGTNVTVTGTWPNQTINASGGGSGGGAPDILFFGDGSDGNLTASSGTTTLTRDTYYNNVTLTGTAKIITVGYRLFIAGILDVSGAGAYAINANGNDGASGSGISGGSRGTTPLAFNMGIGSIGGSGASGTLSAGGVGGAAGANVIDAGGNVCGASGKGGTSSTSLAGGAATAAKPLNNSASIHILTTNLQTNSAITSGTLLNGGGGGAGGGAGGGTASHQGAGSGAGGNGGCVLWLAAETINRGASTAVAAIAADGGASGAGANSAATNGVGGGGGGGGAGGGYVYLIYKTLTGATGTSIVSASGRAGGAGGNGDGTAIGGSSGGGGTGGNIFAINYTTGGVTKVAGSAGTAGTVITTGTAGATGGAGGSCLLTL